MLFDSATPVLGHEVPARASKLGRKAAGAYYTPDPVVETLVGWAVRSPADRLLDPSCGDGRFIARHPNSVGCERDSDSVQEACRRAPHAKVHHEDLFAWAARTRDRFDCAVGNPPFIRYQTFSGELRRNALDLCRSLGALFSGLTSSWAPFLVATASRLARGGRMAFVVPAEIGHAPYAAPLLDYLLASFATVHVLACREKLFPELSEDCWYSVPDVQTPDFFLSYMSGTAPSLVRNEAGCTCTNSVHGVRLRPTTKHSVDLPALWRSPLTRLSCELEGHPLGGGMLKLEPREAARVMLLPCPNRWTTPDISQIAAATARLRQWRHYGDRT